MSRAWRLRGCGQRLQLRPERVWLLLGVSWIVAVTLAPFEVSFAPNELPFRLKEALTAVDALSPLKLAAHFLAFFAVAILTGAAVAPKPRLSMVFGAGVFACVILETAQLFQLGRHARFTDLVFNILAFGLGLRFAIRTSVGRGWCERLRAPATGFRIAQLTIFAAAGLVWFGIGLQPALGALRMDWDPTFPLTIGNEIGGARPWLGRVVYVAVYDRALTEADLPTITASWEQPNGLKLRRSHGLLAGYDFRQDAAAAARPQGNLSPNGLKLTLPPDFVAGSNSGLTTSRSFLIKSIGGAGELTQAIDASGAFTVEALIQPDNLMQAGPARIVSQSFGPARRNFTLGQSGPDLVFRVRNRVNSPNGTIHELTAHNVVDSAEQRFAATYDHGVSTIFKNGKPCTTTDLREPIFHSGLATGPLARAALIYLAIITLSVPALVLFELLFAPAAAHQAALVATGVAGVLPYVFSCIIVGGPIRVSFVMWFVIGLIIVFPVALGFVSSQRPVGD